MDKAIIIFYLLIFIFSLICFKKLPKEKYQFLLVIPYKKINNEEWRSLNITYYGLFNALGYSLGLFLCLFNFFALGIEKLDALYNLILIFTICMPISKLIPIYVEKTKHGFTIAGALFFGIITTPISTFLVYFFQGKLNLFYDNLLPILSTMSVSFLLGESIGRLGCISFGCCYGKKVEEVNNTFLKKVFNNFNTVYYGDLKKASYASNLNGIKTVPIQAMSVLINLILSFIGQLLFLESNYTLSLVITILGNQLFRFFAEFLRADYRGSDTITIYQKMSIINIAIITLIIYIFPSNKGILLDIQRGINYVFEYKVFIAILFVFFISFFYTGISTATYSITKFKLSN